MKRREQQSGRTGRMERTTTTRHIPQVVGFPSYVPSAVPVPNPNREERPLAEASNIASRDWSSRKRSSRHVRPKQLLPQRTQGLQRTYTSAVYASDFLRRCNEMRKSGLLCDVKVRSGRKIFPAHRVLLAVASDKLGLELEKIPQSTTQVEWASPLWKDVSCSAVQSLLDFIYTSRVVLDSDSFQDLKILASRLQIEPLVEVCQNFSSQKSRSMTFTTSHGSYVLEKLCAMRHDGKLCDVILEASGQTLAAHKLVLAIFSDYFRAMFTAGMVEANSGKVQLVGVHFSSLQTVVAFAYTSKITLSMDNVENVVDLSFYLQCAILTNLCSDFLLSNITISTCAKISKVASDYHMMMVQGRVDKFLAENFATFVQTEAFLNLPMFKVACLLMSNSLNVKEEDIFEAALKWLCYKKDRLEFTNSIMKHIRFPLMQNAYLEKNVATSNVVYGNSSCQRKLEEALCYHKEQHSQPLQQSACTKPRALHECLLAIGGIKSRDGRGRTNKVQYLNPLTSRWTTLTTAKDCLTHRAVAVLNNFVYLLGGEANKSSRSASSTCWRYDPRFNSWLQVAPLQQPRADFCACVLDEKVYAIGGRNAKGELSSVEVFCPPSNTWQNTAPLNVKSLYGHAGATLDRTVFISGGSVGWEHQDALRSFSPKDRKWINMAPMQIARTFHRMEALGGKLYVLGGTFLSPTKVLKTSATVERYDPKVDQWTMVEDMLVPMSEPGCTTLEGRIYLLGGLTRNTASRAGVETLSDVQSYDPDRDAWKPALDLPEAWTGVSCCTLLLPHRILKGDHFTS
ncbi:kelch-like protein 26 isoform X2 [Branchiostoma floridae x Branchiostoma belcheri]